MGLSGKLPGSEMLDLSSLREGRWGGGGIIPGRGKGEQIHQGEKWFGLLLELQGLWHCLRERALRSRRRPDGSERVLYVLQRRIEL